MQTVQLFHGRLLPRAGYVAAVALAATVAFVPGPELRAQVADAAFDDRLSSGLRGFYERRAAGNGSFLAGPEIVARNPRTLIDVVRYLPGVRVRRLSGGWEIRFGREATSFRSTINGDPIRQGPADGCVQPITFLDGAQLGGSSDLLNLEDLIDPEDLAAVEAYGGAARVPVEFNRPGSSCGVLVLWSGDPNTVPASWTPEGFTTPTPQTAEAGHTRRNVLIGVALIPVGAFVIKSLVCSLPHYCR